MQKGVKDLGILIFNKQSFKIGCKGVRVLVPPCTVGRMNFGMQKTILRYSLRFLCMSFFPRKKVQPLSHDVPSTRSGVKSGRARLVKSLSRDWLVMWVVSDW